MILAVRGGFVKERHEPAVTSALWAHDRSQTQRQWNQEVVWRVQESDPRKKQVPCHKIAKTRRSPERGGFRSPSTEIVALSGIPDYGSSEGLEDAAVQTADCKRSADGVIAARGVARIGSFWC